jgi:methylated-DNA-[protein]-cysteine S-methyltransferase
MQKKVESLRNNSGQYDVCVETPFAFLGLCFQGESLAEVNFIDRDFIDQDFIDQGVTNETKPSLTLTTEAIDVCEQIKSYCSNQLPNLHFDIKLKTTGTAFQQKVWKALQLIPVGEVVTYGELAKQLNTSARAVGNACRRNPVPVIIPCHRVVSRTGIGGFSGSTQGSLLNIKKWLLNHEGVQFP